MEVSRRFVGSRLRGNIREETVVCGAAHSGRRRDKLTAIKDRFSTDEKQTPYDDVTHYNNFYEFGTDKRGATEHDQQRTSKIGVIRLQHRRVCQAERRSRNCEVLQNTIRSQEKNLVSDGPPRSTVAKYLGLTQGRTVGNSEITVRGLRSEVVSKGRRQTSS